MSKNKSSRLGGWSIILICALFAAPVLLALWLRFGAGGWQPDTSNNGILIQPPVLIEALQEDQALSGHWLLLRIEPADCDAACETLDATLERVRIALGEDADRIKVMPLAPGAPLRRTLARQRDSLHVGEVYVVDPRGFLILRYPRGFDANGLLEDLERLLRYSKIGVQ